MSKPQTSLFFLDNKKNTKRVQLRVLFDNFVQNYIEQ